MKKTIAFVAAIAITLFTVVPAQAQLSQGIKGGLNLTNNYLSDFSASGVSNTLSAKNMTGFFIGPSVEYMIPVVGLGIEASLLYSQKGSSYDIDLGTSKFTVKDKVHYLDLPINLKYKFSLLVAGVYVAAGPYVSYAISGDRSLSNLTGITSSEINKTDFYNDLDLGVNLGAGVELFSHLQVGVQYSWGLKDAAKNEITNGNLGGVVSNFNAKNRVFSVSAAYYF